MFVDNNRWSYTLSPEEEAICAEVGYLRQKPYFGNPKANRNYSEGDIWEMWQHCIAAGSELAFARMMGLNDFVPHVNKWRTQEDVKGVEIKYCFTSINKANTEWSLRHNSLDSRYWGFVPEDHVVGRASLIWFSWEKGPRWKRLFNVIR